jgi:hypothetical protein
MQGKPGAWREVIVIPHIEVADSPMGWIAAGADPEMVMRLQPTEVTAAKVTKWTKFDHKNFSFILLLVGMD